MNFPDGRYGVYYTQSRNREWFTDVIYEFYYTKNQSRNSTGPHKNDAYFNNFLTYRSGWTYKSRIIGVPFFKYDENLNEVVNDRFLAHHFGISGYVPLKPGNYLPYKILLTHVNYDLSETKDKDLYFYTQLRVLEKPFEIELQLGADITTYRSPLYSGGLKLKKSF